MLHEELKHNAKCEISPAVAASQTDATDPEENIETSL
jgi:hypothetical protein